MAIDERDYMRESARRVVEATYDPHEFRGSSDPATPVRRRRVAWLPVAHLVWVGLTLAAYRAHLSGPAIFGLYFGLGVVLVAFLSYREHLGVVAALSSVFAPGLAVLILAFFVHAYQVGEEAGQNGRLCHADQVQLQDMTFTRVSAGVVEARGYLTSACDTSARVKLLVEVTDQTGHTVGRHEVLANFGQPVPPNKTTAIVQPIAVLDQPGQAMQFGIQVQAVDGGAP